MDTKSRIRGFLSQRQRKAITSSSLVPAAVLVPLFEHNGKHHLLFTKRTSHVEHHKGQISFPGGTFDPTDNCLLSTALRECYEEIGLRGEDVEVLGELDDITTKSNFVVTPFVGCIPYPYPFRLLEEEVERLLLVPLPALLGRRSRVIAGALGILGMGGYYQYQGDVIWGATARILRQFLELAGSGEYGRRESLQYRS